MNNNSDKKWMDNLMKNYQVPVSEQKQEPKRILNEQQIKTIKESK